MKKKDKIFYLDLDSNWFDKGDIIDIGDGEYCKAIILETPHKKWYKQLFQFITFGWYKAPTQYKCKIISND